MLRTRDNNVPSRSVKRAADKKSNSPAAKRKKLSDPKPAFDYDAKKLKDPDAVAVFASDIFKYMQHQEISYQLPDRLKVKIAQVNRAFIVDWLIDLQGEFQFTHETLYIAIRLFDIYLALNTFTPSKKHHLVAASSLLIASKFEEYRPASIERLGEYCEGLYKPKEFKAMEREILKTARYDVGFPLAYSFLRRYSRVLDTKMKTLTLARFYLEVSVHYSEWSLELPSKIAAACLVLALNKTDLNLDWAPVLKHYSNYSVTDLANTVQRLEDSAANFKEAFPTLNTVIQKYSGRAFFGVSTEFLA